MSPSGRNLVGSRRKPVPSDVVDALLRSSQCPLSSHLYGGELPVPAVAVSIAAAGRDVLEPLPCVVAEAGIDVPALHGWMPWSSTFAAFEQYLST